MPRGTLRTPGAAGKTVVKPEPNAGRVSATAKTERADPRLDSIRAAEEATAKAGALQTKVTHPLAGTVEEQMASMHAQMARAQEQIAALTQANAALAAVARDSMAAVVPQQTELPTMEEAVAQVEERLADGLPVTRVLTKDQGWYVHPLADNQAPGGVDPKLFGQMLAAAQQAVSASKSAEQAAAKRAAEKDTADRNE